MYNSLLSAVNFYLFVSMVPVFGELTTTFENCPWKTYEDPGDINFAVILSVRESEPGGRNCGEVKYGTLQLVLALKYVIDRLNSPGVKSNQSFIPGVKLGLKIFDDCGNDDYAAAGALSVLRNHFSPLISSCDRQNSSLFAGFIGPSRSQSAVAISSILDKTRIPIIGVSTTLTELSNKTKYPNFFRTAFSDKEQTKVIVAFVKQLGWSMMAVVHNGDNYSKDLAKSIQQLAEQHQICIIKMIGIAHLTDMRKAVHTLLEKQKSTAHGSLGVVYLGHTESVRALVNILQKEQAGDRAGVQNLQWIFPDSVGTNADILNSVLGSNGENVLGHVWSVSPSSVQLSALGNIIQSTIGAAREGSSGADIDWIADFVRSSCRRPFLRQGCSGFQQSDYLISAIHAIYTLSLATKDKHRQLCGDSIGLCTDIKSKKPFLLIDDLQNVSVRYADLDPDHSIPELVNQDIEISFNDSGDIELTKEEEIYSINNYGQQKFVKVGSVYQNGTLDAQSKIDRPSICGTTCPECVNIPRFLYIAGEVLVAGFFSMHWFPPVDDPFGCGTFRAEVHTVLSVEAVKYVIEHMRKETGIQFGAVIFDDCYSSFRAETIVTQFFSGISPLVDPLTGQKLDLSKVVAIIGSESSAVSLPLASSFTRLKLPMISPTSSSSDLDDRGLYPYFLRTVDSDKTPGDIIVAIAIEFGWKYVNLVYSNNNYGHKFMLYIRQRMQEEDICMAHPIPLEVTPTDKHLATVLKTLRENSARVVIYAGLDEDTKAFKAALKQQPFEMVFVALSDSVVSNQTHSGANEIMAGSLIIQPDSSRQPWDDFPLYLTNRTPALRTPSLWFNRFWQSHFQCNLPGSYENYYTESCKNHMRFNPDTALNWAKHIRVVSTINAIASAMKGCTMAHKFFCLKDSEFACKTYKEHPSNVTSFIREIELGSAGRKYRPYSDNGNGNVKFHVLNLQKTAEGSYHYVKVANYDAMKKKLEMTRNGALFYEKGLPVRNINAVCSMDKLCQSCKHMVNKGKPDFQSATETTNKVQLAILIIVCLVVIIMGCGIAIFVRRTKTTNVTPPYVTHSTSCGVIKFENDSGSTFASCVVAKRDTRTDCVPNLRFEVPLSMSDTSTDVDQTSPKTAGDERFNAKLDTCTPLPNCDSQKQNGRNMELNEISV